MSETQATEFKGPLHQRGATAADPGIRALESQVIEALQSCYDPEIPVNIYELGLVYDVNIKPEGEVVLTMTRTAPACPVAGTLPPDIETRIRAIPGVTKARVDVVWDPPWATDKMTEAAKLQLNMM